MTTILLVDDDPLQASLMVSLLGKRFGEVRRATDAGEAFCLIEQPEFAKKLGLVIYGHRRCGIGGPAFVNELRTRIPHLPVLVLGTASDNSADYTAADVVFLEKPFAGERMLTLTGQMLVRAKDTVA